MKKFYFLLVLLVCVCFAAFTTCESKSIITQSIDEDTMWIFAHFNVQEKDDLEDYYYFGRVNEDLYLEIIDGQIESGFILLRDVRYWNTENELQEYEDEMDVGDVVFRVQDIVKMTPQKGDPLELHEQQESE